MAQKTPMTPRFKISAVEFYVVDGKTGTTFNTADSLAAESLADRLNALWRHCQRTYSLEIETLEPSDKYRRPWKSPLVSSAENAMQYIITHDELSWYNRLLDVIRRGDVPPAEREG